MREELMQMTHKEKNVDYVILHTLTRVMLHTMTRVMPYLHKEK
jgi:hypothetical protein